MQYVTMASVLLLYIIVPKKSKKKNSGETVIYAMFILNINDVDALSPHSSLFGERRRILFLFTVFLVYSSKILRAIIALE